MRLAPLRASAFLFLLSVGFGSAHAACLPGNAGQFTPGCWTQNNSPASGDYIMGWHPGQYPGSERLFPLPLPQSAGGTGTGTTGASTQLLHGNGWGSLNFNSDSLSGTVPQANLPSATTGAAGIAQFGVNTGQALQGGTAISNVPSLGLNGPITQTESLTGTSSSALTVNAFTINDNSSITGNFNAVGNYLLYKFNGTGVEQSWGRIGGIAWIQELGPSSLTGSSLNKQYVGFSPRATLSGGMDGGVYTTTTVTCPATCTSLTLAATSMTQNGYTWTIRAGDPLVVLMDSGGVGRNHASNLQTVQTVDTGTGVVTFTPGLPNQASAGAVVMDTNAGQIWGENPIANQANALFASQIAGSEADVIINGNVGEHAWWRYGFAAVSQGSGNASAFDIAFDVGGAYNVTNGTVGWEVGLGFEDRRGNGQAPLNPDGTLIATLGSWTVKNGMDLSSVTITGNAINTPGFIVTGVGKVEMSNVAGGGVETIGPLSGGGTNTAWIDFHSSGNSGNDVRIGATAGSGTGNGDGNFQVSTTGNIIMGTGAALPTGYTTGGLYLPFTSGTPTGTQTNVQPSITWNKATHTLNIYDVSGFFHITATAGAN